MTSMLGIEFIARTTGITGEMFFGELQAAYARGITVGGVADCSLFLDHASVEGIKAGIAGASNHRFFKILSAPPDSPFFESIDKPQRVDSFPFEFGMYTLRILELDVLRV